MTTFETSPPQTVDEAQELLRTVGTSYDLEEITGQFAVTIYPLCCVVDAAFSGAESPEEDVLLDVCERFDLASRKLIGEIRARIEYMAACDLVGRVPGSIPPSSNDVPSPHSEVTDAR